jgi:hypothetical protein
LEKIVLNRVVSVPSVSSFTAPSGGNDFTATWTFSSQFPHGQYLIRLGDTIDDLNGASLDGEWISPGSIISSVTSSVFPSGNGTEGGDFEFVFSILQGDMDRSNSRTNADIPGFLAALQDPGSIPDSLRMADTDGSGTITNADLPGFLSTNGFNQEDLAVLGDYLEEFFVLDGDDEDEFLDLYNSSNSAADLNGDGSVTTADYDAFYALFNFAIELDIVT